MPRCSFTGQEIPPGTGKMYVKKDGKILWFSSRSAEKNFLKLGRNPRNVRHTRAAKQAKQQHLAELAHEKEAKRVPVKKKTKTPKKDAKPAKEVAE